MSLYRNPPKDGVVVCVDEMGPLACIPRVSVAPRKGAILAPLAPWNAASIWYEPFAHIRRCSSERPGAVKGAPLLGAAKRTLDGENRSERMHVSERLGE